ncbi:50S ribosomal protein L25 [Buchnera aphidicola (Muscaphis stroyani)]|uniref:Large ribosomal subunit protein bL25 n=1 Tax=Buchnera aphidicola (Muscaphis stroyani) TaxID=1241869 RepID=A0A4D6Y4G8_9GAMM|nr:50S ribosomal protein L25 [Buchnera aphidicola]QCI24237.1 50S ribosomal protein L25 [Buchnera aphidicola (Muscaphis stroyani)]
MLKINAIKRIKKGKSYSRKLRMQKKFPGILYGMNKIPVFLELDHNLIFNLQKKIEFYKENICLIIEEKKHIVKVQSIQRHAFKLKLLHIDFLYN